MPYFPRVEFNDLASAIQHVTGCSKDEAANAASAAQKAVDRHRGEGSTAARLDALQARHDKLVAAIERWFEAPHDDREEEEDNLLEESGVAFRLTPRLPKEPLKIEDDGCFGS